MLKIATHNSGTGEKSRRWYHCLLIPFAQCQSKSISQQWENGCRYFDLRVRMIDGEYHICHGIWESKATLTEVLTILNTLAGEEKVYVIVTYEGTASSPQGFCRYIRKRFTHFKNLTLCSVNVKKPTWTCVWNAEEQPECNNAFVNLDGSTWHTYLPIPWLWDRIYSRPHQFNEQSYTRVDFL